MSAAPATRFMTVVGHPKTIALAYSGGKITRSRFTQQEQMMYTLSSGERAWFDLDVAHEIDSLHLAPGEPFTVCHHGGHRWSVERAQPARPTAPPYQAPPAPAARPAPRYAEPGPLPESSHSYQEPAYQPPAPPPTRVNGSGQTAADLYVDCFAEAVTIALKGVELAKAKGLLIAPAFEDVRTIATTLHIGRRV